ncbi:glycosyl hydrolase 53 family protein [Polaribacter sp. BAL334]|uniref:glycosyl hydrolase 53 family protein n=1 Tax=Polaribacter sp. BAL334 TaxID=1708178 RepID=UPI0018D2041C|nr:glycosyl hydrolase 53 family protein [Polaribacter sp. BAL334]MBG7611643.1 glycosyl hydrolase 53 family protein [Polaribacter sp. BAL334]
MNNETLLHKITTKKKFPFFWFLMFVCLNFPNLLFSQSIEISSFNENPLEVSPLLGATLTINFKYSSEVGSSGNHIYIGLEILDSNNSYVKTIDGVTLLNQQTGNEVQKSVSFFVGSSNPLTSDLPNGNYYQVKATLYKSGGWTENAWAGHWNTPALVLQNTQNYTFSTNPISKGADISWMTEMQSNGIIWKDNNGVSKQLMPLLKEYDLDAVRLRVWVNPDVSQANGWCDIDDLVAKAELAKAAGLEVMICIHYSDWWADPGQQTKPAAWINFSVSQLETAVYNHTTDILTALSAKGITPKWVQIGNETNDGMLWNTGKASTGGFANYAKFLNAGTNAVKTFNTNIKTILHLASGNENGLFRWNIDGLLNNGMVFNRFDIIGMSLYPDENNWISMVNNTYNNMLDMKTRYTKDVMMVEVGFSSTRPDISHQFLTYIIEKTRQANGLGVFYWEPIAHKNWNSYSKGAWDEDGSPSIAMDAFIDKSTLNIDEITSEKNDSFKIFPNPSSEILQIQSLNEVLKSIQIYDMNGRLIQEINSRKLEISFSISHLLKGVYFLRINNEETIKFIKN